MKNFIPIIFILLLFASCSSDVGRYEFEIRGGNIPNNIMMLIAMKNRDLLDTNKWLYIRDTKTGDFKIMPAIESLPEGTKTFFIISFINSAQKFEIKEFPEKKEKPKK